MEVFDPVDTEHLETFAQGTIDLIKGTESVQAEYAKATLWSDGCKNVHVQGVESFIQSVKGGVDKAIEYIKKMIKSIIDFFFSNDAKKKVAKKTQDIKETEKTTTELPKQEFTEVRSYSVKIIKRAEPEKKLEDFFEEKKEEPEHQKKARLLRDAQNAVVKSEHYAAGVERIDKSIKALEKHVIDAESNLKDKDYEFIPGRLRTVFNGTMRHGGSQIVADLRTAVDTGDVNFLLGRLVTSSLAMGNNYNGIPDMLSRLNKKLDEMTRNSNSDENAEDVKSIKAAIAILQGFTQSYLSVLDGYEKLANLFKA